MYEKLRGRVSRIISVGVSSIIGAIEGLSPEGVMEEAINEVNGAIQEVNDELGRVLASKHMAEKRLKESKTKHEELNEKIVLAVSESRDDLAEAGIAHQLDLEAQLLVLHDTVEDLDQKEKELRSYTAALGAKKREMQDELARFRASRAVAGKDGPVDPHAGCGAPANQLGDVTSAGKKAGQATSAFDRILAKETGVPSGPASSMSEQAKLAELDFLDRGRRVKERLAAIKAKHHDESPR